MLSTLTFRDRIVPVALLLFLILCFLAGGASRADVQSQVLVRIGAVLLGAVALIGFDRAMLARIRVPLALLGALALLMIVQLIPLPPGLWPQLGGREPYLAAAASAGIAQPWRPISLTPDLTLNSLAALLPAAAVLLAGAALTRRRELQLVPVLIAASAASAVFGILQLAGGMSSPLYLYAITTPDAPVGLFANRNHHALMLAIALALGAYWAVASDFAWPASRVRAALAAVIALLFVAVILATGSRAGLVLGVLALATGAMLARRTKRAKDLSFSKKARRIVIAGAAVAVIGLVAVLIIASRATTLTRLSQGTSEDDLRFANLSYVLDLASRYFPFGSGFGSFDPVFRAIEPDATLMPTYYNHAHNDLLELAITGGVPALLILAAFALWWVRRAIALWRGIDAPGIELGRAGCVVTALALLASLADYPLRTPTLSMVFAIGCLWMCAPPSDRRPALALRTDEA